jgi:hypothetical protein
MSRIQLNIERLVIRGFGQAEAKSLVDTLRSQLHQVLLDRTHREDWALPHRTPVLKLGRMPLEAGAAGAGKFGREMARSIKRGLKP